MLRHSLTHTYIQENHTLHKYKFRALSSLAHLVLGGQGLGSATYLLGMLLAEGTKLPTQEVTETNEPENIASATNKKVEKVHGAHSLAALEQQDGNLTKVEVDKVTSLMGDI